MVLINLTWFLGPFSGWKRYFVCPPENLWFWWTWTDFWALFRAKNDILSVRLKPEVLRNLRCFLGSFSGEKRYFECQPETGGFDELEVNSGPFFRQKTIFLVSAWNRRFWWTWGVFWALFRAKNDILIVRLKPEVSMNLRWILGPFSGKKRYFECPPETGGFDELEVIFGPFLGQTDTRTCEYCRRGYKVALRGNDWRRRINSRFSSQTKTVWTKHI